MELCFEAVDKDELILDNVCLSTPLYNKLYLSLNGFHSYPHAASPAPFTGSKIYEGLFF